MSEASKPGRLTAAEARNLAGPTFDETVNAMVDGALAYIRQVAEKKGREVHLNAPEWVHGGYSQSKEWKAATAELQRLGYTVELFYEERQFVNMYTVVKW